MVSKALESVRKKGRKNRVTIEDKYIGQEPFFEPGTTNESVDAKIRQNLWAKGAFYYNYYYASKEYVPFVLEFAKDCYGYDKDKISTLKKLKDYELTGFLGKVARLHYRGYEYTAEEMLRWENKLSELYATAVPRQELEREIKKAAPPTISIAERTRRKLMDTVYAVWDEVIIDGWIDGDYKKEIDIFNEFKTAGLKGNAINPFKELIDVEYKLISDAVNKTCEQAIESYEHISMANKKKMLKTMDNVYSDLEKLQQSFKATRGPRIKKRKASDVQVSHLKYNTEDMEFKITSISPVTIPGKETLWVFNAKNKTLYEYVTTATSGFEVGGTTIKNFEPKLSKCARLRKPDVILPLILTKTPKQIAKIWKDQITTKINEPNGRINTDCVLLRVS